MSVRQNKVMVIGLDGLTLKVLLPLVQSGQLPTFARLLANGAHTVLHSVTNMTTGPTWASFATGCQPQQHGILHDFHHSRDSYLLQPTKGSNGKMPAFWQLASNAGRRVIVLNVPLTYPVQPVNGVILAGIDAPSERAPDFAYPKDSYQAIRRHAGDYLIDCGLASYMQAGRVAEGVAAVARETAGRTRAAEYLMQQQDWDLLVVVYSLPDVWQHYYWTAPVGSAGHEQMLEGYRQVDHHLARLLKHLPDDGVALICSDHGFGPLLGTRDHLNQWLAKQGFLHYKATQANSTRHRLTQFLLKQIRQRASFRWRQQLLASVPSLRRVIETSLRIGDIDWTKTQVYAALDHLELWVNVRGRQPNGCVELADYANLCDQVTTALLNWRDDQTGLAYIKTVERTRYRSGGYYDHLPPDLSLTWNSDVVAPQLHPLISGDHTPDGTLIVAGKDIQPGQLAEASLVDVAPIALRSLGLPVPTSMEGRVPVGLFT